MMVEDYIEETNSVEVRQFLLTAHQFLLETLPPFVTHSIKWRIPFYTLHKNFCYINRHSDHITLGFPNGYRLSPRPAILLGEDDNLKQVRYLEIRKIEDLYSETTLEILQEAILLDETNVKNSLERRRKRFAF